MKKGFTLKKKLNIAILVVGILVVSMVGTKAATTIGASMVTYNDTTVKETLDKLIQASVSSNKVILLGTGTVFNVSSYEGYEDFTADNFIVETLSGTVWIQTIVSNPPDSTDTASSNYVVSKSYDSSTGRFVVSHTGNSAKITFNTIKGTATYTPTYRVYLIYG